MHDLAFVGKSIVLQKGDTLLGRNIAIAHRFFTPLRHDRSGVAHCGGVS